jgi:hypothetical protein
MSAAGEAKDRRSRRRAMAVGRHMNNRISSSYMEAEA